MADEISVKILTQATENIQKLADFDTRIDERVRSNQLNQEQLSSKFENLLEKQNELYVKILQIEAQSTPINEILQLFKTFNVELSILDKRITQIEKKQGDSDAKWKGVATFFIQLTWVILAAYLLTKLNLQAPAVP